MPNAEKISITLTADMLQKVRQSVETGEYASTSEVLRDALRLWQQQRADRAEALKSIRARIHRSLNDPTPSLTEEEVDAHLDKTFGSAAVVGDSATRRRMTVEQMLAVGAEIEAMPLLDARSPQEILDDLNAA